ncbi:ABC transporter permease subunit [Leptospira sp. GIMC2001]|uniref:ABC transporter permease subunit n=1 Tax=Leptospira sp. GIMC2001 TaxID=1513297 RepID=UPI00234B0B82|nr:ABC transporter permease [Leptospira sp. GIMC2001]WCL48745.1 ABC transporter permease [Leptospira sp. GIMC2001]
MAVSLVRLRITDRAYLYADSGISQESIEEINRSQSFHQDFFDLLQRLFSTSGGLTENGESIYSHIAERIIPTLQLALFAITFGILFSIFLTLESVAFPKILNALDSISGFILSTPVFIFSVVLLIVFFYKLEVLPPGGYEPFDIRYLVLPGISLGIRVYARLQLYLSREARSEMESPYFVLLLTRGMPKRIILYKHLFTKIFPTFLVLIVLDLGSLISGAIVVEEIFFFPGIGRSLYYSIRAMDKELLQSLIIYSGVIFYILNRTVLHYQKRMLQLAEGSSN